MNSDNPDIADQPVAAIPQVYTSPPPTRQEAVETAEQTFRRVLGYLCIEEGFIDSILRTQRIRNFRVDVLLTEEQRKRITCSICLEIYEEPVEVACCRHVFCKVNFISKFKYQFFRAAF